MFLLNAEQSLLTRQTCMHCCTTLDGPRSIFVCNHMRPRQRMQSRQYMRSSQQMNWTSKFSWGTWANWEPNQQHYPASWVESWAPVPWTTKPHCASVLECRLSMHGLFYCASLSPIVLLLLGSASVSFLASTSAAHKPQSLYIRSTIHQWQHKPCPSSLCSSRVLAGDSWQWQHWMVGYH